MFNFMIEQEKFLAYLRKNWSKWLLGITCVAAIAVFVERNVSNKKTTQQRDLVVSGQIFSGIKNGKLPNDEALETISDIFKRNASLKKQYSHLYGLALLARDQKQEALEHLSSSTKSDSPQINAFNEISLLIEQGCYPEALKEAQALNEKVANDSEFQALYICNLVRTLFLAKEAGDVLETHVLFEKVQEHPLWARVDSLFQQGSLSLSDYINNG